MIVVGPKKTCTYRSLVNEMDEMRAGRPACMHGINTYGPPWIEAIIIINWIIQAIIWSDIISSIRHGILMRSPARRNRRRTSTRRRCSPSWICTCPGTSQSRIGTWKSRRCRARRRWLRQPLISKTLQRASAGQPLYLYILLHALWCILFIYIYIGRAVEVSIRIWMVKHEVWIGLWLYVALGCNNMTAKDIKKQPAALFLCFIFLWVFDGCNE